MNKKASILDGIFITVMVLVLFLSFSIGKVIWEGTTEDGNLVGNDTQAQAHVNRYNTLFLPMWDNFFIFVIFGAYIAVFIVAFFIRGTPVFLPIMITIIVIGGVLSVFVANAHQDILDSSPIIADAVADWDKQTFLIENLPLISMIYLIGLTAVMLALGEGM